MYLEFVSQRSNRSKWLRNFHEVALAMSCIVAAWIYVFLTSHIILNLCKKRYCVCSFQQSYVNDLEYNMVFVVFAFFPSGEGS